MSDYLKSILNAFHDLLFVFSKDGIIEDYLTPNHQDALILPGEDFLGKNYQDVLPPQVSENLQQAFKQLEQGEEQVKFDYKLELKGEKHWFEAVISKMAYENESGYLGAVRNITRRKNYELLLRGVLNTSPGGIMVFRTVRDSGETIVDFEITHINKTVEELIGITEEELIGQRLTVAIPRELKDTMFERFKTVVETEKPVEFEYQHEPEPGSVTWYFAKLAKYKDGVISSFLNITKQKKNE
ncbi:MAG: PAS domain S-box protein, partial [Balneolaceae bacterium]